MISCFFVLSARDPPNSENRSNIQPLFWMWGSFCIGKISCSELSQEDLDPLPSRTTSPARTPRASDQTRTWVGPCSKKAIKRSYWRGLRREAVCWLENIVVSLKVMIHTRVNKKTTANHKKTSKASGSFSRGKSKSWARPAWQANAERGYPESWMVSLQSSTTTARSAIRPVLTPP